MSRRNSLIRVHGVESMDFAEEKSRGKKCFNKQDWSAAATHYTNCIEIARAKSKKKSEANHATANDEEDLVAVYSNRAEAFLQMADFDMALNSCKLGLQMDPRNLKLLYRKGRALHGLKQFSQSMKVLQEALDVSPGEPDVLIAMQQCKASHARSRQGEYDVSQFILHGRRQPPQDVDDVIGDVEIRKTKDGRGWGLYAAKDVGAGELVLVSNAVAVARGETAAGAVRTDEVFACLRDELVRAVTAAAEKSEDLAWRLCALDDGAPPGERVLTPDVSLFQPGRRRLDGTHKNPRVPEIVSRNSLPGEVTAAGSAAGGAVLCGLWLLPSFINHSCAPNCGRVTVGDAMFLHAAKDIKKGEEITICYTDVLLPLPVRQVRLEAAGFKCICRRCSYERSLHAVLKPLYGEFEGLYEKAAEEVNLGHCEGKLEFPTDGLRKCEEFGEVYLRVEEILAKQLKMKEEEKKWVRTSFVCSYLAGIQSEEFFPRTLEDPFPARVEIMQAVESTVPCDVRTLVMAAREMKEIKAFGGHASEEWAVTYSEMLAFNACIRVFGNHREDVIQVLVSRYSNCRVF